MLFFQQEFKVDFSQKLQKTFALINNTHFKSSSIIFKERQIKSSFRDFIENYFFSSKWIVDKTQFRTIIKRFLKNIVIYRLTFQKFRKFEKLFAVFSSAFTKNKFLSFLRNQKNTDSSITNIEMSSQAIFNNINKFFSAQLANLFRLMFQIIDNKITELRAISSNSIVSSSTQVEHNSDYRQIFKDWNVDDIEFFNFATKNTDSIVNINKHVFYKNIYAFTNKLKNMTTIKSDSKLKTVISQCFREFVLIWHSIELTDFEKEMLRNAFLTMWYNVMIKRFKKRISIALINMQTIKYTLDDARQLKNSRLFAQNLFRFAKVANLTSIHNQLIIAWNNLTWKFRQHISKFTKNINIRKFLKQLDNHVNMWHEMIIFRSYIALSELSSDRKYSKSFYQNRNERNIDNYFNRAISYDSNNAYNNSRQKRSDRSSRVEVTIKIEKASKNRDFDRNKRNKFYDKRNKYEDEKRYKIKDKVIVDTNDFRNDDKEKFKIKIYMIQNEAEQECNDDHDDYNRFDDLKYFDLDYEKDDDTKITVSLTMTFKFICRRCKMTLKSNNAFHKHLKICMKTVNANAIVVHINFLKFTISLSISIKSFNVDVNKNIDTDYDFKKYQYAFTEVFLTKHDDSTLICADTETEIILMNAEFFSTTKNVLIRTMIISITVRELNTDKHFIDKYVIVFMYFFEKDKNDTTVKAKIIRKIYLINDLKTNMLLENDVLNSKKFDIFTFTSSTYIESCEIIISIFIKNRFMSRSAFVHFTKTRIISSRTEISIFIHKISLSERDYLFESAETNFFMYFHIVNIIINVILMRNDNAISIKISKNLRLNKLIELKHLNALMINFQFANFAIRRLKSEHKNSFFQMTLKNFSKVFLTTVDKKLTTNIVLFNDITVHDSSHNASQRLCKLIEKYSSLWTNQEFANLSKNNWMKLSLKTDWETKIKEKAKIYSLKQRDKALINEIFNKLHI